MAKSKNIVLACSTMCYVYVSNHKLDNEKNRRRFPNLWFQKTIQLCVVF